MIQREPSARVIMTDDPRAEYLVQLIQKGSESDRTNVANAISSFLERMKTDVKTNLWERWLKEYWHNRNLNIPRTLDSGEYREMLCWLLELPDYDEAVELALKSNVKIKFPSRFLYSLCDTDIIEKYPEKTAQLIIHLIKNSDEMIIDPITEKLIERLKNQKISLNFQNELENILK